MPRVLMQWSIFLKNCLEQDQSFVVTLHYGPGADVEVRMQPGATVEQLMQAEAKLQGVPAMAFVLTQNNEVLPEDQPLVADMQIDVVGDIPTESQLQDLEDAAPLPCPCPEPGNDDSEQGNHNKVVSMPCPRDEVDKPYSMQHIHTCCQQCIAREERIKMSQLQATAWADDEVQWGLQTVAAQAADQGAVVWNPLWVSAMFHAKEFADLGCQARTLPQLATVITAIARQEHWIPVVARVENGEGYMFVFGVDPVDCHEFQTMHRVFCEAAGVVQKKVQFQHSSFAVSRHCGAMAIAYARMLLCCVPMPSDSDTLDQYGMKMKMQFEQGMAEMTPKPYVWAWGETDPMLELSVLLKAHGVPSEEVEARTKMAIERLGVQAVRKAIGSVRPWQEIKSLANAASPMVQLVLPSELQQVIAKRKPQEVGHKKHKQKGENHAARSPTSIDPASVRMKQEFLWMSKDNRCHRLTWPTSMPVALGSSLPPMQWQNHTFMQVGRCRQDHWQFW